MVPFKLVIPARYASTRLPGKPLIPIAGRAMIAHVCDRAQETGAEEVIVAVDDERIRAAVEGLGVTAMLTRKDHASGTARLLEVAQRLDWPDDALVINLQGDEPLMDPALVQRLVQSFAGQSGAEAATLAAPMEATSDLFNPNAVKVVMDREGYALYFSRAPIPWFRGGFDQEPRRLPENFQYCRHIGIYAYRAGFLRRYAAWEPSPLESIESLEQLRILWHGKRIHVLVVEKAPEAGVDTEADLLRVERVFRRRRDAAGRG